MYIKNRYESNAEIVCSGIEDDMIRLIERIQLKDRTLWDMVIGQFTDHVDDEDNGWRCEYWGKLMRGACTIYSYTKDAELYDILRDATERLIALADENGRIATYSDEHEFCGWDMWGRKYVLLGLIHFYEICSDSLLKEKVISAACGHLDYIISKVGTDDGKIEITDTSEMWGAINSSSILEPVVRLYGMTEKKEYLEFAEYIVNSGGAKNFNIFEAAYENILFPYEYPVIKAYELMSCFEGLLEYYRITGIEKWRTAVINFTNCLIETEITVIGSAGCSHELFNHSSLMQTYTGYSGLMQETCVTVTWIKLCSRLLKLTGDSKYADEIEKSVYNALYGAVNTENCSCGDEATFDEPYYRNVYDTYHSMHKNRQIFDSYSPIRADIRGKAIGGFKPMLGNKAYCGCCVAIGAMGIGMVPSMGVMKTDNGCAVMMYIKGKTKIEDLAEIIIDTEYPKNGEIEITVNPNTEREFEVLLRIPYFSDNFKAVINGAEYTTKNENGILAINRKWHKGDVINLNLDMNARILKGMENPDDELSSQHIAVMYGPLTLAREKRLGETGTPVNINTADIKFEKADSAIKSIFVCKISSGDSEFMMMDYASSGKTWRRNSETEVWIKNIVSKR